MTATAEFMNDKAPAIEPVRMADGGRMIVRGTLRLFGAAMALAAIGLWLAPGASWDSDIMLFKLILSLCALIAGIGMLSSSSRPPAPEVEIDSIRREVRLVRRLRGAAPVILQSCTFGDLAHVEHSNTTVRLWDKGGAFLAEVNVTDRSALSSLLSGLRDAGKLA